MPLMIGYPLQQNTGNASGHEAGQRTANHGPDTDF